MSNTDDTMRRIEEALDYYDDQWKDGREKLLATIRAALPQPTDVRVVSPDHAPDAGRARFDFDWGGSSVQELTITATESDGTVTRFVPQQDDAEHERAVEAWKQKATSYRCSSQDPPSYDYNQFILDAGEIDDALRLMRRQPKETTDGK